MFENDANSSPSQNDEHSNSSTEYLRLASQACASGDAVLGMHLYLAAFERAQHGEGSAVDEAALEGLKQAWQLACKLKERSIAEYAFERLEPYLSSDEAAACAEQLQRLALDKLEEFGLTREDLEDMTDMISQDFLGIDAPRLMKVEHVTLPRSPRAALPDPEEAEAAGAGDDTAKAAENAGEADKGAAAWRREAGGTKGDQGKGASSEHAAALAQAAKAVEDAMGADADAHAVVSAIERISYADIVGYNDAVALMRDFGLGMQDDPQFQSLVELLNARHGLDRMPASDALLFRSPAREDANRFMAATLGELGLPAIRMHMEENLQGMPVLCVMAQADRQPKLNAARNAFEGAGVLMLEDLDLWMSPMVESAGDDLGGFIMASLSRGAREAISLIRSAVENPDVFVLASSSEAGEIDPFFFDLLEPLSVIDIDFPTVSERDDIWMEIAREHPSLRGIDRASLVRYSAQMPRYDMYMAAREAIEEAYKASLVARRYLPVTADNLYDKLAAYQPLDSAEYAELERLVVSDFSASLGDLNDLVG